MTTALAATTRSGHQDAQLTLQETASCVPTWFVLCPPGTVLVPIGSIQVLADLAPGTPVALVGARPLRRTALRRACREHDVRIDRELLVLPSVARPWVVLDDDRDTVSRFWRETAAIPPLPGWLTAVADLALVMARRAPWRWTGALAPGRIVLGERR